MKENEKVKHDYEGTVRGVFVMAAGQAVDAASREKVKVTWEGFEGDKHAGLTRQASSGNRIFASGTEIRNTRQISIVSEEELAVIAERMKLPEVKAEWVGANLSIENVPDLSSMPIGTRLVFEDGAAIVVEEENMPCLTAGKSVQKRFPQKEGISGIFPKAALHKRGLVGWVEREGTIREGDKVLVYTPSNNNHKT